MAQKALGIEIGEGEVRGVLLEGSAKKYKLAAYAAAPIAAPKDGESPEEVLSDALADVAERLGEAKDSTAISLSSTRCSFRPLVLPFIGEDQIRQVVKFELEGHLHQWNIDDVVVDFYTAEESKGKSHLLVAAAPKEYLKKVFGVCEQAGFDPVVADLDATALFNAAMAAGALEAQSSHLLLHLGKSVALLLVVENQTLRLARCVRTSKPKTADAKVSTEKSGEGAGGLGVLDKIEEKPVEAATDPSAGAEDEEVFVSIEDDAAAAAPGSAKEVAAVLQREVNRTLTSVRLNTPIASIYLSGEWETIDGLADAMASRFQLPVLDLDLLSRIEHGLSEEEADRASSLAPVAFGAALKLMDVDFGGMNFRQEDLRFTKRFDQVKTELSLLLGGFLLLLMMENIYLFKNNESDRRTYQNMVDVAMTRVKGYTDKEYKHSPATDSLKRLPAIKTMVASELDTLKKKFGQDAEVTLPPSALEAWRLVFLAIQEVETRIGGSEAYRIEKVDVSTREGGSKKEPDVLVKLDLVFLGNPAVTATALEAFKQHMESKRFVVPPPTSKGLTQGEGIQVPISIEVRIPEGQP